MKIRSKKHLRFVAEQGCMICGGESIAHHLLRAGGKGMGTKACDSLTVPLCNNHHMMLHRNGNEIIFFENHGFSYDAVKELANQLWSRK